MGVDNKKGPLYDNGSCRCCGAIKKCRLLTHEYEWLGQKEVYSDMFVECFGLILSHLESTPEERLVCATCVVRLRSACDFRQQVLQCEEKLLKSSYNGGFEDIDEKDTIKPETCEVVVKIESTEEADVLVDAHVLSNDHFDTANDDNDPPQESNPKLNQKGMMVTQGKQKGASKNKVMINKDSVFKKDSKEEKVSKSKGKSNKDKTNKKAKKNKNTGTRKSKAQEDLITSKVVTEDYASTTDEQLLSQYKDMEAKLKDMENVYLPQSQSKRMNEEDLQLWNAIQIIEHSYVCPFDTSFSDFYCIYCRSVFTDPNKLREHTLIHDPKTLPNLPPHKKLMQVDVTRIDCRVCNQKIDNVKHLKEHLLEEHSVKLYPNKKNDFLMFQLSQNEQRCLECESVFPFFHALKRHMAVHFGTFICDICGAHYFQERMLILHQKRHEKKIEVVYNCKHCGKDFKTKAGMTLHVAKTHTKESTYMCNKCDEIFFSYTQRYRHLMDVHGIKRTFKCEHCDRVYDSRKSFREHTRRNHLKVTKHQCELCDKRFYLPSRLREHMVVHTGERNYRCDDCGKSYPRLRALRVHIQSHAPEKKYKCAICTSSFNQNVCLKNHIKRHHQSLDPDDNYYHG